VLEPNGPDVKWKKAKEENQWIKASQWLFDFIADNLGVLCKQKYGSRVVELAVRVMPLQPNLHHIFTVLMEKRGSA